MYKTESIYVNMSAIVNELLNNLNILSNYDTAISVVHNILDTVLNDDFTIKSMMSTNSHHYNNDTHSVNVSIYALNLGKYLGLPKQKLIEIGEAALLHDLGYQTGFKFGVKNLNVLSGIKYHTERIDGSGSPHAIIGDLIPLNARIVGLCDDFDNLTSNKNDKEAMSVFEAIEYMKKNNTHDSRLLDDMIKIFK